ncbi:MAG TPA: PAS domain S-box protein [Alphaproteobacteria bacterium]
MRDSVAKRLLVVPTLTVAAVLVVFFCVLEARFWFGARGEVVESVKAIGEAQAPGLAELLARSDHAGIKRMLKPLETIGRIRGARVFGRDGELIAEVGGSKLEGVTQDPVLRFDLRTESVPGFPILGTLVLYGSNDGLFLDLLVRLLVDLIILVVACAATALAVKYAADRGIVQRLMALRAVARLLTEGDLRVKSGEDSYDEIGELGRALDLAANELRSRTENIAEDRKSLTCLLSLSRIADSNPQTDAEFLQHVVHALPTGMRKPSNVVACITYGDSRHSTEGFYEAFRHLTEDIVIEGETVGSVTVCYIDDQPFADEERKLIRNVASWLGGALRRRKAWAELSRSARVAEEAAGRISTEVGPVSEGRSQSTEAELGELARHSAGLEEELRQRTAALERSREATSAFLEQSPDPVVVASREGAIAYVNRRAEQLFGIDREKLIGKPVESLVPERLREAIRDHIEHKAPEVGQETLEIPARDLVALSADRREIPVQIGLGAVALDEGEFLVLTMRDASELRDIERRCAQFEEQRSEADERVAQAEKAHIQAKEKLAQVEREHASAGEKIAQAERARAQAEEKLAQFEEERARANEKISKAEAEQALSGEKVAVTEGKLAETAGKLAEAEAARARADERIAQAETARAQAEEKLAQFEEVRARANEKISKAEAEQALSGERAAVTEGKLAETARKLAEAEAARARADERIAQAETARAQAEEKLTQFEEERARANEKISKAEAEQAASGERAAVTEEKLAETARKLAEAEAARARAEEKLAELEEARSQVEQRAVQAEEKLTHLDQARGRADERLVQFEEGLSQAEQRAIEAAEKLARLEEARVQAEKKLAEFEERHSQAEQRAVRAEGASAQAEEKLAAFGESRSESERRADQAAERLAQSEEARVQAEKKLAEFEEGRSQAERRAAQAEEARVRAEERFAQIEGARAQANEKLSKAEAEQARSEQKVAETEEKLAEALRKLAEADEERAQIRATITQAEEARVRAEESLAQIEAKRAQDDERIAQAEEALRQAEERLAQVEEGRAPSVKPPTKVKESPKPTRGAANWFGGRRRRQLEEELRERTAELERYRDTMSVLLEQTPDAVLVVSRDGAIGYVNKRAEQMFGMEREKLADRTVESLVPERLQERLRDYIANKAPGVGQEPVEIPDTDFVALSAEGHEIPVEIMLGALSMDGGEFVIITMRDVSGLREIQEWRLQIEERLARADGKGGRATAKRTRTDESIAKADEARARAEAKLAQLEKSRSMAERRAKQAEEARVRAEKKQAELEKELVQAEEKIAQAQERMTAAERSAEANLRTGKGSVGHLPSDRRLPMHDYDTDWTGQAIAPAGVRRESALQSAAAMPTPKAGPKIPEIPGVDVAEGLRRSSNDSRLYLELLRRFAKGQQNAARQVREAMEAGDRRRAIRLVQTARDISVNIGARAARSAALELEDSLKKGADSSEAAARLESFASAMESTVAVIAEGIGRLDDAPSSADAKESSVNGDGRAILERLANLLESNDAEASELFESHGLVLAKLLDAAQMAEITTAMENFDYEIAAKHCRAVLGHMS